MNTSPACCSRGSITRSSSGSTSGALRAVRRDGAEDTSSSQIWKRAEATARRAAREGTLSVKAATQCCSRGYSPSRAVLVVGMVVVEVVEEEGATMMPPVGGGEARGGTIPPEAEQDCAMRRMAWRTAERKADGEGLERACW